MRALMLSHSLSKYLLSKCWATVIGKTALVPTLMEPRVWGRKTVISNHTDEHVIPTRDVCLESKERRWRRAWNERVPVSWCLEKASLPKWGLSRGLKYEQGLPRWRWGKSILVECPACAKVLWQDGAVQELEGGQGGWSPQSEGKRYLDLEGGLGAAFYSMCYKA